MRYNKFIVLGSGGHARVIIDLLNLLDFPITGLIDNQIDSSLKEKYSVPVIGDDSALYRYEPGNVSLALGMAFFDKLRIREKLFNENTRKGYEFPCLIHPSAVISNDVVVQAGVQIMAGAIVNSGTNIGKNCIINTQSVVEHDCEIGNHIHIAPGAVVCGGVVIQEGATIGANATILQGKVIGGKAKVGAGAVVLENVNDFATVVGNPASEI